MQSFITRIAVIGLSLLTLAPAAAMAQDARKMDVSAGYQMLRLGGEDGETMGVGWYGDLSANLKGNLAAVFQVTGNYKSYSESLTISGVTGKADVDLKVHSFMGGARLSAPMSAITPFAQVLVGGINASADGSTSVTGGGTTIFSASGSESSTEFAMQVGGGVNVKMTDRIGLRVGADYIRIFADEGANAFRLGVGAVFPF